MNLSEAIRLGAMLRPQGVNSYLRKQPNGVIRSCALGAAAEAAGSGGKRLTHKAVIETLEANWPWLFVYSFHNCAFADCDMQEVRDGHDLISHLNDHHHLTREQIAALVEIVERLMKRASAPVEEPAEALA